MVIMRSLLSKCFLYTPKRKASIFKFLRFEDAFSKSSVFDDGLVWIRSDGLVCVCVRNSAFSNFQGVLGVDGTISAARMRIHIYSVDKVYSFLKYSIKYKFIRLSVK